MTTSSRARGRRLPIALVTALCIAAAGAHAGQDKAAREEIGAQIEELGTTLRAAAMSGAISGPEARQIYGRVVRAAKAAYVRDFGEGKNEADARPSAKGNTVRLRAPRPERIDMLLRAEFRRRDLEAVRNGLDLDGDQAMIVEHLFRDYEEAYDLAATPLREALAQYRGTSLNAYIAFALEDAGVRLDAAVENARRADRAEAVARMGDALARIDREKAEGLANASAEDRLRYKEWKASMIVASSEIDERLAAIRDRATAQLADMGRTDVTITAQDVIRLATQLRSDRTQLRTDLVESLETLATAEQRGEANARFEGAIARIRIRAQLPHGRLGGESMDLWAALAETRERAVSDDAIGPLAAVAAVLWTRSPSIAAALDERTEAAIDREIEGLEYQAVRDRIAAASGESIVEVEKRRLASAVRPYVAAAGRELTASVAVRDALLALLDECAASIGEGAADTGLSTAYRGAALRRGFPVETRQRWAERALASALDLEELDDGARETLRGVHSDVAIELTTLRGAAIAKRIARDPRLARDFIDSELEGIDMKFDDDVWREPGHAAFAVIDDRVEALLRGILVTQQFERLPRRRGKKDVARPGRVKKDKAG